MKRFGACRWMAVAGLIWLSPAGAIPVDGQAAAPAGQGASAAQEHADPDKRVCKRTVVTGSRFVKMVCHTQAQWDEMERGTRSQMREIDATPIQAKGQ